VPVGAGEMALDQGTVPQFPLALDGVGCTRSPVGLGAGSRLASAAVPQSPGWSRRDRWRIMISPCPILKVPEAAQTHWPIYSRSCPAVNDCSGNSEGAERLQVGRHQRLRLENYRHDGGPRSRGGAASSRLGSRRAKPSRMASLGRRPTYLGRDSPVIQDRQADVAFGWLQEEHLGTCDGAPMYLERDRLAPLQPAR
jgi:hypothetical protein